MPIYFLGENAHFFVNDQLDSVFVHNVILSRDGNWLKGPMGTIASFMGGIPRHCFQTSMSVTLLAFILFKPINALIFNIFFLHIIAFVGMFLLLKKHVLIAQLDTSMSTFFVSGIAFCFAFPDFFYLFGLSIAGQPLLLYAFLNFLKKEATLKDFVIILCFPLYSFFVFASFFIIIALGLIWLVHCLYAKKINIQFLLMLILFILISLAAEHQLLYGLFFDKNFISHRTAWDMASYYGRDIYGVLNSIVLLLYYGLGHARSSQDTIINFILPITFIVGIGEKLNLKALCVVLGIIFLIILFASFSYWFPIVSFIQQFFLLKSIHWDRFCIFNPMLWCIVLAICFFIISKVPKHGTPLLVFFLFLQIYTTVTTQFNFMCNFKLFCNNYLGTSMGIRCYNLYSFKQFFSTNLFSQIAEHINRPLPSYKIISIGMFPGIAQYNGFYTLDGYIPNYPLSHKNEFRKIFENELYKNAEKLRSFDSWGSRCYLFVREADNLEQAPPGFMFINHLELNTTQLKKMGCQYIVSALRIQNHQENGLKFMKFFRDKDSPWHIFLYQVEQNHG